MKLWTSLLELIAPRPCLVCRTRLNVQETHICSTCLKHLPLTDFHLHPQTNDMALRFAAMPQVARAAALLYFNPHAETANLIYALKYLGQPDVGITLGRMAARRMGSSGFFSDADLLVPVPLTASRQRKRGYNQSEMICRGIAQQTGLPIDPHLLRRTNFQGSQTHMLASEREQNTLKAFKLTDPTRAKGKHIVLVDDIFTTGSTMKGCCAAFSEASDISLTLLVIGFTRG